MVAQRHLPIIFIMLAAAMADPAPGRIPKVYNALITSNQNLEPSKAYSLYQPVLQNPYPFSYQNILYDHYPNANGLVPMPYLPAKYPEVKTGDPGFKAPEAAPAAPPAPAIAAPEPSIQPPVDVTGTPVPSPPKTESPIPLNQFGLPPQVVPINQVNPYYKYPQLPFPYTYPGLPFYNPYSPYGFNAFPNYPFYQPPPNILQHPLNLPAVKPEAPTNSPLSHVADAETSPAETSELNVLNYTSKDPAIPNVPPPPLPEGGLKTNEE